MDALPLSATLAGFVLVVARTGALVLASPVLGQGTGFSGHRVALIAFLSLLLFVLVDGWHLVCESLVGSFVST